MKVLLLVIHQVDSQYDKMYEVQSAHYARYPFLDTYFVCFSENLEAPFSIEKDIIFIKGTCLLYTSPSPRDRQKSRMPSSA